MHLPRGDEYNMAVQSPTVSFTDNDLKVCTVETTPLGLPKPYSGGFTITYKLWNKQSEWAVRCFHRDISDLQKRYQTISKFIENTSSKYFVEAKYLSSGIKVNGVSYPIIKMKWLQGEPLNIYLNKNYSSKIKVDNLIKDFLNLVNELERFEIAHGDLQHGNIIVKNDSLYLIDYDGMYFPELYQLKTNEIGHINYQHPKRTALHYDKKIDRFSAIVIYIGLKAISTNPSLWKKYDNSENILFKSQDFADLKKSPLVIELLKNSETKLLVEKLIGCCHLGFENIPNLKDFLTGNFVYDNTAEGTIIISRSQYLIFDASNKGSILEHFGEKIEVVGKISGIKSSITKFGDPYLFLNFVYPYPNHTFTVVIWQEGIVDLQLNGISANDLVGKWVSITGVIASYNGNPQTVVDLSKQIQIFNGETEAKQRLLIKNEIPIQTKPSTQNIKQIDKEAEIFNNLYHDQFITQSSISNSNPSSTSPQIKSISSLASKNSTNRNLNVIPPIPVKPLTNSGNINKPTTPSNENSGCLLPVVFGIIGAILLAGVSKGKLWFIGALIGAGIGSWIQSLFKK